VACIGLSLVPHAIAKMAFLILTILVICVTLPVGLAQMALLQVVSLAILQIIDYSTLVQASAIANPEMLI